MTALLDVSADLLLRPAGPLDDDFLGVLYADSRAEEVASTGWPAEVADAFLAQQRRAQEQGYRSHYPSSRHDIVLVGARSVGRLWVDRSPARILLIDISLLASERGRGTGGRLIADLLAEADASGVPVELSVATHNVAAERLYRRHGFVRTSSTPTHHQFSSHTTA